MVCQSSEAHLPHPFCDILRGLGCSFCSPSRFGLRFQYSQICDLSTSKLNCSLFHADTPLWYNKQLGELLQIPDPKVWIIKGIFKLLRVFQHGRLKPFEHMKVEFTHPNHMLFRYLQLRHTLHAQFDGNFPLLPSLDILAVLKGDVPCKLISTFYDMLLTQSASQLAYSLKPEWEVDAGEIDDED